MTCHNARLRSVNLYTDIYYDKEFDFWKIDFFTFGGSRPPPPLPPPRFHSFPVFVPVFFRFIILAREGAAHLPRYSFRKINDTH